jgi:hypothetical protein
MLCNANGPHVRRRKTLILFCRLHVLSSSSELTLGECTFTNKKQRLKCFYKYWYIPVKRTSVFSCVFTTIYIVHSHITYKVLIFRPTITTFQPAAKKPTTSRIWNCPPSVNWVDLRLTRWQHSSWNQLAICQETSAHCQLSWSQSGEMAALIRKFEIDALWSDGPTVRKTNSSRHFVSNTM